MTLRLRRLSLVLAAMILASLVPALPSSAATVTDVYYVPTSAQGGAMIRVEVRRNTDFDAKGQGVLLNYSPYNSIGSVPGGVTGTVVQSNGDITRHLNEGIAAAAADVLGTRGSTGCWDYGGLDEQQSGIDVVNFLSGDLAGFDESGNEVTLDWSNGNVGMTGVSYEGTTANMVAAAGDRAPGLKAVVPIAAISHWYGYAFFDGVRYFLNSESATDEGFDTPLAFDHGFSDTLHADNAVEGAIAHNNGDCGATEHTLQAYSRTPDYTEFWEERDYSLNPEEWRAATMLVHGWNDYNVKQDEAIALYEALAPYADDPDTEEVDGIDLRLWMTQSRHANGSGAGYAEQLADFWRAYLLEDAAAMARLDTMYPRVRTDAQESAGVPNRISMDDTWPLSGTETHSFFLNRTYEQDLDCVPACVPGPGTGEIGELSYTNRYEGATDGRSGKYDSSSGWTDAGWATEEISKRDPWSNKGNPESGEFGGQGYYSLHFSTGTLNQAVQIAGRAELEGYFAIGFGLGVPGATITPILVDIAPNGSMTTIQRGFMNIDYRDSLATRAPSNAGPVSANIRFLPEDYVVAQGNRIGMILQSSNAVWALPGNPAGFNSVLLGPVADVTDTGTVLHLPLVNADGPIFDDAPGY